MIRIVRAALLAAAASGGALPGCTLIDQTTFAPEPDPKPAPPPVQASLAPAAPADARAPLLTIRYDTPEPDYATVLPIAVHTTQQRRPGAGFDVVAAVPSAADAAQGQVDAAEVSRAIVRLGAPGTRIRLSLRIDPSAVPREVLVYPR